MKHILILENIRSSYNVGSIFRIADSIGVKKIYLVGYTPRPIDKFKRENKKLTKIALGSEKFIKWEYKASVNDVLDKINDGYKLVAVEQNKNSISYKKYDYALPTAFVFGNEVDGVSETTQALADSIIEIEQKGKKESLNVGISVAIILYYSDLF